LQTSQPHAVAFADAFAAQQFIVLRGEAVIDFACRQAQLPHSQTSQLHTPLQFGHLQSMQPHAAFAWVTGVDVPAIANAYVRPRTAVTGNAKAKNDFMIKSPTEKWMRIKTKVHRLNVDSFQPRAVERQKSGAGKNETPWRRIGKCSKSQQLAELEFIEERNIELLFDFGANATFRN